jgi:APA family basic amino acid/polyamine antiporter
VRRPRRTIPRAITIALAIAVVVYALVAVTLLAALGLGGLAATAAPLSAAVASTPWAGVLVRVAAAAASLGALLALLAGVSRTALAMARAGDLPRPLAAVHPRHRVPHHAEVAVAGVVVALVLAVDLRGAIGFSSFGVLAYYLVANVAAFTQTGTDRRFPRALQVFGAAACAALCLTLPTAAVLVGAVVLAVGVAVRAVRLRLAG